MIKGDLLIVLAGDFFMSCQPPARQAGIPWLRIALPLLTLFFASALIWAWQTGPPFLLFAPIACACAWVALAPLRRWYCQLERDEAELRARLALVEGQHDRARVALLELMKKELSHGKRLEECARASLALDRLRRTIAAAGIATWDWDILTNEMSWSDNFEQVLGITEKLTCSLEGFLRAVAPEDHTLIRETIEKSLQDLSKGELDTTEYRAGFTTPYRWIASNGRLFRDGEGRPVRMMGTIMDVTGRRLADAELRRASAAKSNFLASMSHEMRTPLNGVIGMVELLSQTRVSEQQRDFLATLSKSAESLLSLVTDVLDISKIEAGALDLEEIAFDLRQLVADALGLVRQQAERKKLLLTCKIDPAVPLALTGDPGRLSQVLLNLLSNAVKFTNHGKVEIVVRLLNGDKTPEQLPTTIRLLHFEVRDTGVGIASERQGVIFEPFAQAESSTARTHGGTGLGLTISSRLVERMGGRLTVESTPGEGSSFAFTVPLKIAVALAPPRELVSAESHDTARVLLAEDNTVNQQVLTLQLEKAGYRVEVANNGKEALELLQRERFDIVLMDVQMPVMDGLRATRLIRQHEKAFGGHVPIVAVTANAVQGERQRCLSAGMDDYLSKPVRGAELFATVARLLGERARLGEAFGPDADAGPAWAAPLAGMGFDRAAVAKLARTFLDTVPQRLEMLGHSVRDGDAESIRQTAHSLKGSLAVFGIGAAIDAARRLEQAGRDNRLADVAPLLNELIKQVEPLLASMANYANASPTDLVP